VLKRTLVSAQAWKLWLGLTLICVAGLGFLFPGTFSIFDGTRVWPGQLVAVPIFAAGFGGLAVALKCPSCRLHLFWYAVSKKNTSAWLNWLLDTTTCPRCGYQVQGERHEP
jgi:hypothetical protein